MLDTPEVSRAFDGDSWRPLSVWEEENTAHGARSRPEALEGDCKSRRSYVPGFFREPELYETLQDTVFPRIGASLKPGESIRIWIPGCSSGEEVYSIAIALHEYLGDKADETGIKIFGTDVRDSRIQKARRAVYSKAAVKNVSLERLDRFFVRTDEGYQVGPTIRERCVFMHHNLTSDPPLSRMNLLICRNLPAGLTPDLHRRVLDSLWYALKSSGFLILGRSKSLSVEEILYPLDDSGVPVYSKTKAEADLRLSQQELRRLSARLLTTAEEEGKRIARELHDSVGPHLARVNLEVSELEGLLASRPGVARKLRRIGKELSEIAKATHNLSRSLHPAAVSQLGLVPALEGECATFSRLRGIAVEFSAENLPESLPEAAALCLYRVAQEALENIRKHARTNRASLRLAATNDDVVMLIQDFGSGFDPDAKRVAGGLGLVSMEERVRLVNGSLKVRSKLGEGTRIEVRIPRLAVGYGASKSPAGR